MSEALSRAEVEAMDRDELIETLVELSSTVDDLQARVSDDFENAAKDRSELWKEVSQLRAENEQLREELEETISDTEDRLHRDRSKLMRRVAAIEEEIGIETQDAVAIAEAGREAQSLTKLGRLMKHGPEAVSDRPTERMRRAKTIAENWSRWGTLQNDAYGKNRRLASAKHDLKTRLEDARDESLAWRQIYRAMQLIDEWSGRTISLEEGNGNEGKHVLVQRLEGGDG
jgi:regulator of replication initiation timing